MIGLTDTVTVAISITGIDIVALKKLAIVSHALAGKIGGTAGLEQKALAGTLDDLLRQIEINTAGRS
ncbi:hypothetical protein [Bradyrhizobium sp. SRS-191]|uniref:hypothetical protein n=1 Tax=Bradyrhizobium sp. SRS-191 TaxID=2962606 RepID=UPI00211DDA43|nr:hypothetical protein [Bradyrhizobium sp. SRS-191]